MAIDTSTIEFELQAPSVSTYLQLRKSVGWSDLPESAVKAALDASLVSLTARCEGEVIGIGRVVGDGYFYIQDVIVASSWRGQGIGTAIVRRLLQEIRARAPRNAFVGLMAAAGTEPFYTGLGFQPRPSDRPGMYLIVD